MQRIINLGGEVDIKKFLDITKREYLPVILERYHQEPFKDLFNSITNTESKNEFSRKNKKWWRFWK